MTDIETLKSMIAGLESKTAYGRLEPLMPTIDRKIKDGVRRADIHEMITAHGIDISAGSFYTYLWRYRKRNSSNAKATKSNSPLPSPMVQPGDERAMQVEQDTKKITTSSTPPSIEELLTSEKARDEFSAQFMNSRPLRHSKKK